MLDTSLHLPNSQDEAPAHPIHAISGTNNTYNVDAQHIAATVFHKSAIGTVKLKDMVVENTYDPRRLGNLMTARLALGHGILRPEAAVSIKQA